MTNIKSKTAKVVAGLVTALFVLVGAQSAAAYEFTSNLSMGMTSPAVMELQKVLNMSADTQVAASGVGSAGMETSYFGGLTKTAVIAFQNKYASEILAPVGLTSGTGFVGSSTRAKLNTVQAGGSGTSLPAGCTSTSGFSTTTGVACNTGGVSLPAGCTSTAGFSPTTGAACNGGVGGGQQGTGAVMASLSASTPASGYILDGQATAGLLDVVFSGNGTVSSVTLKRSGISDQNTLTNVYLYDGVNRLTDGYSFNSTGEIVMNNLNLAVNGSKVISVKADASATASNNSTIAVAVTSYSVGATVNTVNIKGNDMALASGSSLASASFTANTVTGNPTVNAGSTSFTFWSAPLQVNTRALMLKSANFRMIGSAPADALSNIRLYVDGVDTGVVASVMNLAGSNYAVFDFSSAPRTIQTGSHTLHVTATVEKGSSRTVQFSLQQAADLMIMDPQLGVNLAVSGTIPNSGASISINSGSITVSIDSAFNALTNITGGSSNSTIAKFKLRAYGEDVKVSSLDILPVLTSMTPNTNTLDNVTLYFNGSQIGTQQDFSGTALTFNLGSQLIVPAGVDSILEVRSDIRSSSAVNYTAGDISANLVVGSANAQGQNSFTSISTPARTGNILTVQTGNLVVSKNTGYANQSVNPNTSGVKIGSFTFQNQSSSEAVRVTNLVAALAFGAGTSVTNYGALRTSETSGNGSIPVQTQATNGFSVDFVLAPGATKTVDLLADTGSDAGVTATVIATLTGTSIGVTSNVAAAFSGGAGQTITSMTGTVATPTFVTNGSSVAQLVAAANGGASDATKATFNFTSTGASSTISELKFTVTGTSTVSTVKVGNVVAPVVSGIAYLTGLSLNVPQGGSGLNQDVFVSYSEVGSNGITSEATSAIALTYVKYSSGGTTATLTPTVTAPTMVMVGSKPSLTLTDSGAFLTNGQVKVASVTVTADAKGDIKLVALPVTITSTGNVSIATGTNNIIVQNNGSVVTTTNDTLAVAAGGSDNSTITFTGDYLVTAGSTVTFDLFVTAATVTGGPNANSLVTALGSSSAFAWEDTAGNSTTSIDGADIYNYPTNTSFISDNS